MSDIHSQQLGSHEEEEASVYDGIVELDNPAPFWWQFLFYLCIAFAVAYYAYYEMWGGPTLDEELQAALTKIEMRQREAGPSGPGEKDFLAVLALPEKLKSGRGVFSTKCASCHAADGGGGIGPNLTDKFWIHGKGAPLDIAKVVSEGVLDKGMPPWGSILSKDELVEVVAYVKSIQGSPVSNPKAPQGNPAEN